MSRRDSPARHREAQRAHGSPGRPVTAKPAADDKQAARRAAELVERGPAGDSPTAYGPITRAARRVASRLNRHERSHQRDVDRALLDVTSEATETSRAEIRALAGRLDDLVVRAAAIERHLVEVEVLAARTASGSPALDAAEWRARLASPAAPADGQPRLAVRVETDVGPLLVSEHDRVVHHVLRDTGTWEKEESDALRAMLAPGMTFVDIGAHVGYMSLVAAAAVGPAGRGIALEPAPGNFELLQANLMRNRATHVAAVPAAAWKETGPVQFSLSDVNTGDHRAYARPGAELLEVPGLALDDIIPDEVTVHVVKVDAQGTDHLALQGMARTLARCRPVLLVEYWPQGIIELGDDPVAVLAFYREIGFTITVLGAGGLEADASLERIVEVAEASPGGFCNLVLRPA